MQPPWVHFKQHIRQAKCTAMDHKCSVHFAIIHHPITLDKVLETYDVSDGFLAVPNQILVVWYLAFLGDLRPPPLLVIWRAFLALIILDANFLLQHKSKVDWLSRRSTFLKSNSMNFLCFKARTILGWCSLRISNASWKWLEHS